jgi:hypothetical protein
MREDPGGHFASDEHRRVMAAMANPDSSTPGTVASLAEYCERDDYLDLSLEVLVEICLDLEASGFAARDDCDCWRNTDKGWKLLTGPPKGAKK